MEGWESERNISDFQTLTQCNSIDNGVKSVDFCDGEGLDRLELRKLRNHKKRMAESQQPGL